MNSKHFSNRRISRLDVAAIPQRDLWPLDLDANQAESLDGETSVQHIPLVLEYNNAQDWYWRYGEESLYKEVFSSKQNPGDLNLGWLELHCWISNYAWVEPAMRFILNKPCWPLHSEVVDRLVALYLGRKSYEEHRTKGAPKDHSEFFDLLERMTKAVEQRLAHCELLMSKEGDDPFSYIRHTCDESGRSWVPSLLHRVLAIDDIPLPPTPIMNTTFSVGRFDNESTGEKKPTTESS